MKKVTALVLSFFAAVYSINAANENENPYYENYNGQSYIFVEGGVEFSVFPDGQFDFVYVGNTQGNNINVSINTANVSLSYNSGYNYDAFVQYDDYGAVIQVEEVPIYYDEFGRIIQAGSVEIRYTNRRIVRVGGMHIFYNHYGYFSHYTGFISPWYTTYVYRPWHVYYARPFYTHCIVYDYPYRRYYSPIRYSYHHHRDYYRRGFKNYTNGRREFARVGSRVHYKDGRTAVNKEYNPNRRNTAVAYNNRKDDATIYKGRPVLDNNTTSNRPVTNTSRPKVENDKNERPSGSRGDLVTANTRPKVDNSLSKDNPSNSNTRPFVKREDTNTRPTVSKGKPATYSKPKAERTKPMVTNKSTRDIKSANTNTRSTTSNRKTTSSNSRSSVAKRGRG
ncbi:MAG: hypothetical protein R2781_03480 [Flavobacteriaceae bacterium]